MSDDLSVPEGVLDGIIDVDNGKTAGVEDLKDVLHGMRRALDEQLNYEIKAAYRMGYEYVHCYWRINPDTFMSEMRCYHAHTEHPLRGFEDFTYTKTYVLREEELSEKARRELQS